MNNNDNLANYEQEHLRTIEYIAVDKLEHFNDHPFKLYEGERYNDMLESIKANGILVPIIIRVHPTETAKFEILSGHNRVKAAKEIGLKEVPSIIRENISDEEAKLIVVETNLIQRSLTDLSHSERATALATHYEAIKHQGKRTDLINKIKYLLDTQDNSNIQKDKTLSPEGTKSDSMKNTGEKYNMSKQNVARYIRINNLINDLKSRIDNEEIAIRAGVEISFLTNEEQKLLNIVLENHSGYTLDTAKAQELRTASKEHKLTEDKIKDILTKGYRKGEMKSIKIEKNIYKEYFPSDPKPKEVEAEIIAALKYYRENKNSFNPD